MFLQVLPWWALRGSSKAAMSVGRPVYRQAHGHHPTGLASLKESVGLHTSALPAVSRGGGLPAPAAWPGPHPEQPAAELCRIDLFRAAVAGCSTDPARRLRTSPCSCIRFPLMRPSDLVDNVQTLDMWRVEDVLCMDPAGAFSLSAPLPNAEMQ